LFRKACSLRAKGFEEAAIRGAVLELNKVKCSPPLEVEEVLRIVESALKYDPGAEYHPTDLGNAKRLVHELGGDGIYIPKFRAWNIWAGSHWPADEDGEILRRAKECTLKMLDEAKMIGNPELRKARVKWARTSQSKAKLLAMVDLANSELGVPVAVGNLDTHRHLLNVQNGTIDLRTGELLPHDRAHLITRVIPLNYHPDATCPTWEQLNLHVADGKEGLPHFLHRVAGYCATGETREQCFFILYGSGANGKSTWLNGVRHVLGPYAMQTPAETLLTKWGSSGISNDVARLRPARFVTASEIEDGRTMNQSLVKEMTGGEPLSARFLYGEFFEFKAEFKLLIGTNHRPKVNGSDPAIFRRIRQVPFTLVVPPERQDRELNRKLAEEAEGILAWIVRGAVEWYANGLQPPPCVTDATEDYRREMDHVGQFIDDRCQPSEGAVRASDLFRAYKIWTSGQGIEAMTQNALGRELSKRGYQGEKRAGVAYRYGLALAPDPEVLHRP
jgi:putative DNA primase/helicase